MITDGEKWRYLAIKKLPALLRGKILNCFNSYSTKKT